MFAGDEEEHAVLLTNYFLHLEQDAYLCIGQFYLLLLAYTTLYMIVILPCMW